MKCASCGAGLAPIEGQLVVECDHCGSQTALEPRRDRREEDLKEDLAEVDKWWQETRRPYGRTRGGRFYPPEKEVMLYKMMIIGGMVLGMVVVFGVRRISGNWVGLAGFFGPPVLISLPGALLQQRHEERYKEYQELEKQYQARRSALIDSYHRRTG